MSRVQFEHLLNQLINAGGSDLHLTAGVPPIMRIHGELKPSGEPLAHELLIAMTKAILSDARYATLEKNRNLDFSYTLKSGDRFRINTYYERTRIAFAIRRLADRIANYARLGLPPQLSEFCKLPDGLVLVTGPTGSGKSTTLASMIDEINRTRACHILTIEDPIEYVHANQKALVHQRELLDDVPSFADAVRAALREDPDVILVGEMRDLETMRAAVTAAETGHLVFGTLHSGSAVGAIDRLIGAFPAAEQDSVRHQLALVLRAVVTQHLMPALGGRGRVSVVEILNVTIPVASLIRQNKPRQIMSMMETGHSQGMQTHDHALADLVANNRIDEHNARLAAHEITQFDRLLAARRNARIGGR